MRDGRLGELIESSNLDKESRALSIGKSGTTANNTDAHTAREVAQTRGEAASKEGKACFVQTTGGKKKIKSEPGMLLYKSRLIFYY
jgi:hypothetical protein